MRTLGAVLGLSLVFVARAALATPFTVYDEALSSSFSNTGNISPNYASTTNPHAGTYCISAQLFQQGQIIMSDTGTPDISQYGGVDFWHRTSAGSMTLVVSLRSSTQILGSSVNVSVTSTWTEAHLTLADFGLNQNSGTIVGIEFGTSTLNVPQLALDDITLFDASLLDAGVLDSGVLDSGVIDSGVIDSGVLDAGGFDAALDASLVDSGSDASISDASTSDASASDAATTDAATADASKPDAAQAKDAGLDNDAGGEPNDTSTNGCSCDLATPSGYAQAVPLALVALALIARRRRS